MNSNHKNEDFLFSAMRDHGIPFPHNEASCGIFMRWGRNNRYWLVSVFDGYKFGDFVSGMETAVFPQKEYSKKEWSMRQRAIEKASREAEKIQNDQWKAVADKANQMWQSAQPCEEHEYLKKKNVIPIGLRCLHTYNRDNKYIYNNTYNNIIYNTDNITVPLNPLVVPLYLSDNNIVSLQYIYPDGKKRFLKGGRKRGCYFPIGKLKHRILLAEGYATACSIFLATGELTICCFDAGNLLPVAEKFRQFYPDMEIIICADGDSIGISKAIEAGKAIDAVTVFPVFPHGFSNLTDFNDLASLNGRAAVNHQISQAFQEAL